MIMTMMIWAMVWCYVCMHEERPKEQTMENKYVLMCWSVLVVTKFKFSLFSTNMHTSSRKSPTVDTDTFVNERTIIVANNTNKERF